MANCPITCRRCSNSSRRSRRARRALSWSRWRTFSTRSSRALLQRQSAYASVLGALLELAGEKAHAGRSRRRRTARSELARAAQHSTAVLPRARRGPDSRNRFTSSAKPRRNQERTDERRLWFSVSGLSVCLLRRVHRRQPDSLRPSAVQLEERLVADAALRIAALGQQSVSHRNPVPVLRPPGRAFYAACGLRRLHERGAEADARSHGRRYRRASSVSSV